ncbi:MAG: SRPBCC family protein [Deltaproteobacteria bacterium]|nr:SRPBCC family protein [Deltaproteobacteria bacterium]
MNAYNGGRFAALLLVVLAAGCASPEIRAAGADKEQEARLARGEVLTSSTTDPLTKANLGIVTGVIDYPVEQVWAVVSDYDRFSRFIPLMKESQVVSHEGTMATVRVLWDNANLPISFIPISIQYWSHLRIKTYPRTYFAEFQQIEGNLKRAEGTFLLEPFPDAAGKRSRVVISIVFQIGDILDLGARGFFERIMPYYVTNMRRHLTTLDPSTAETRPWAQVPQVDMQKQIDALSDIDDVLR